MDKIFIHAIADFIEQCKKDGQTDAAIINQLYLFSQGVRDSRLGDNCIILIDCQA